MTPESAKTIGRILDDLEQKRFSRSDIGRQVRRLRELIECLSGVIIPTGYQSEGVIADTPGYVDVRLHTEVVDADDRPAELDPRTKDKWL
jgi:hypothetical protein